MPGKVWLDGELIDADAARVSVYDHGVLYGDGCFEGIRCYNNRIFKLQSHLDRMWSSAERIRLEPAYSQQQIAEATRQTLATNNLRDGYIRLVFTRGVGTLGLHPFKCPTPGTFIITDTISLYPEELYQNGMHVIVANRRRVPTVCLDPAIKSLNYLNNILAKIEAIDAGVLEAIMLNTNDEVAECTGDNLFTVVDGALHTPPDSAGILHGITRGFVMHELAPALGLDVHETTMTIDDVIRADEVFLTGTAAEVIGVSRIDDRVIGSGKMGPVTARLVEAFRDRVKDNAPED